MTNQRDIFYSQSENLFFWVAGYTRDNNTSTVTEIIADLKSNADEFCEIQGGAIKFEDVKTHTITTSRRYKHMRVFWATVAPENVPESAFKIGGENSTWTMWKWLQD